MKLPCELATLRFARNEGSFAEVGQLIAGTKFASFFRPDMASKSGQTLYTQSLAQLRQTSLQMVFELLLIVASEA